MGYRLVWIMKQWGEHSPVKVDESDYYYYYCFVFTCASYLVHCSLFAHYFIFQLIRYTAFSELLPLLAVGATPLLKVKEIRQVIDTGNLTIVNSTTLSGPFATFSFSATATFEIQSPTRIKVLLWAISIWLYNIFLRKWNVFSYKKK